MINNSKKTKEMILESHKNNPLNKLCVGNAEIESVSVFKLLLFVFFQHILPLSCHTKCYQSFISYGLLHYQYY